MKGCVFAGTFDPVTVGHLNVIEKCITRYGKVLVVVGKNPKKDCLFSEADRVQMLKKALFDKKGVEIAVYSQIENGYAEYLQNSGYTVYARGIRGDKDIELENSYKEINQKIYPFITTEYIYCDQEFAQISSSMVRQKILGKKEYLQYIPESARVLASQLVSKIKEK